MKDIVLRAEQAAFDFDPRVTNSEGAEFAAERGQLVLANSLGFARHLSVHGRELRRGSDRRRRGRKEANDYWFTAERRCTGSKRRGGRARERRRARCASSARRR